jgi:hypothetical protein
VPLQQRVPVAADGVWQLLDAELLFHQVDHQIGRQGFARRQVCPETVQLVAPEAAGLHQPASLLVPDGQRTVAEQQDLAARAHVCSLLMMS